MYVLLDTRAIFFESFASFCETVESIRHDWRSPEDEENQAIVQRFINCLIYFGRGCLLTRPSEHFQVAASTLAGRFLTVYLREHDQLSSVSTVSCRIARIYAQSCEREKRLVDELLRRNNALPQKTMSAASPAAKQELAKAEAMVAAAQAVGAGGPAAGTLLTTHSVNFAAYIEERLISWIGQSRVNQMKGKTPSFVLHNRRFTNSAVRQTIVVFLIGRLLSSCTLAVVEKPLRLFSGAHFSIYTNVAPCFHRYTVLESPDRSVDESLIALLPDQTDVSVADDDDDDDEAMEVDLTTERSAVVPPTSVTLLPLKWPLIKDTFSSATDYNNLVIKKFDVSTVLADVDVD